MASLIEFLHFAGWVAIVGALIAFLLGLWQDSTKKPLREAVANAAMMSMMAAFQIILVGAIINQIIHGCVPARDVAASSAAIATPLSLTFATLIFSGAKDIFESTVGAFLGFACSWLGLSAYGFVVMYMMPRLVGFAL